MIIFFISAEVIAAVLGISLLFGGLAFRDIVAPIAGFLEQYYLFLVLPLIIGLIIYSIKYGKEKNSVFYGISAFFSVSQLLSFTLIILYAIVELIYIESDPFLSILVVLIIGWIALLYLCFDMAMVLEAFEEENKRYKFIVTGVIGWIVNCILLF